MVDLSRRTFLKGVGVSALGLLAACAGLPSSTVRSTAKPVAMSKKVSSLAQPPAPVEVLLPGNKRIKIAFQFSSHRDEKDGQMIGPLLDKHKPHVVCIENAFGDEKAARSLEADYELESAPMRPFYRGLFNTMRKKQVPHAYVLERESYPQDLASGFERFGLSRSNSIAHREFFLGGWENTLYLYREHLDKLEAKDNVNREEVAKKVIRNLYTSLVKRFPELEKEKEIRVAVKYGSAHTPLYAAARKAGFAEVTREIQKPLYFFPSEAHIRRATFNRPNSKGNGDEVIARTFMGDQLGFYAILDLDVNRSNAAAFGSLVSRKLTLRQFRRVSSRLAKLKSIPKESESYAVLADALRKEGVTLPQSKEEVHAFLERKRIPLALG
ncbi:MAG: twin-arginine translocation signal domain-containing protein [Candidatus Micrarchaeota archaeon]